MPILYSLYAGVLIAAILLASLLLFQVSRFRLKDVARSSFALMLLTIAIELTVLLSMIGPDAAWAVWWHGNVRLALYALLAPVTYYFAYSFARRPLGAPQVLFTVLLLASSLFALVYLTNDWHHWMFSSYSMQTVQNFFVRTAWSPGWGMWVFQAYIFVCAVIFIVLWLRWAVRMHSIPRRRGLVILGMVLMMLITIPLDINGIYLAPGLLWLPLGLAVMIFVACIVLWFTDLFDVLPVSSAVLIRYMTDNYIITDDQQRLLEINPAAERLLGVSFAAVKGQDVGDLFLAREFDLDRDVLQQQDYQGEVRLLRGDLQRWFYLTVSNIYLEQGYLGARLIVLREITHLKQLQEQEREQRLFAEALQRTTYAIAASLELEEILDQLLCNLTRIVVHDYAEILFTQGKLATLAKAACYLPGIAVQTGPPKLDVQRDPYLRRLREQRSPILVDDLRSDPGWKRSDLPAIFASYCAAPILSEGELIGVLGVYASQPGAFQPILAERLQAFAEQIAIARSGALNLKNTRRLAALEERQRLARDLHDAVSQTIFSARLTTDRLVQKKDTIAPDALWVQIQHIARLVRSALGELRILMLELRPESLASTSLPLLLSHLVDSTSPRTDAEILLSVHGQCKLPTPVHEAFYRIAQEALNNAIKHSGSPIINVDLWLAEEQVQLRVQDDGRGFDLVEPDKGHLGLSIMQERAAEIGADLEITSHPGLGASLTCTWHNDNRQN